MQQDIEIITADIIYDGQLFDIFKPPVYARMSHLWDKEYSNVVYVVSDEFGKTLYIGSTYRDVFCRLTEHINKESLLGMYMAYRYDVEEWEDGPFLLVLRPHKESVRVFEYCMIKTYAPVYNVIGVTSDV